MHARKASSLLPILLLVAAPARAEDVDPSTAAKVGSVAVSRAAVEARAAAIVAATSYHRAPSPEAQRKILREALDALIDEALLDLEARRRGLVADPAEVDRRVADQAGKLGGQTRFVHLLARQGSTLQAFRAHVARQVLAEQLMGAVVAEVGPVTRADAKAYYEAHRDRYVMPRALQLRAALVKVDPSRITEPGHRDETKQRAEALAAELKAGAAFEALAPRYPRDELRDLGWVHEGALVDELGQAVTGLEPGAVSAPVPTTMGFYVVQLLGSRPPVPLPFDQVADAILAERSKQRRSDLRDELLVLCRRRWPVTRFPPFDTTP